MEQKNNKNKKEAKRRSNFAMKPSIRKLLDEKAEKAGFPSASAYLEFLIKNS